MRRRPVTAGAHLRARDPGHRRGHVDRKLARDLNSTFPARQRGRALGLFTTATYLGLAIGPSLGGAALSLYVFLHYEARTPSPMLDLRLFRRSLFSAAIASAVLNYVGAFTTVFLMPFCLISGRGGMLIQTAGLVLLSQLRLETPMVLVIGGLTPIGLGVGLFSSPNTSAALGTVPAERRGVASGVLGTARNVAMLLGIAMAGAVFSTLLSQAGAEPSNVSLIAAIRAAFLVAAGCTGLGALALFVRDRPDLGLGELESGG